VSSDDLSSLFVGTPPGPAANAQFRQAVILSFSKNNGSNTVGVGTSVLTNVPMALTGAEVDYVAGDPVILLVIGNTYMILCKVVAPGSAAFGSASVATASARGGNNGFTCSTGTALLASCSVTVPSWANTALVTVVGTVTLCNFNVSGTVSGSCNAGITGQAFPAQELLPIPLNLAANGAQVSALTLTGLSGGQVIQGEVDGGINPATAGQSQNQATVTLTAIFYKQ
jgi:hypothetical protein